MRIGATALRSPGHSRRAKIGRVSARVANSTFSFMGGALPAGAALARASTGWVFDNAGVLQSAAVDVARFPYDTTTLAARGLWNEPTATNGCRNSNCAGAVPGTPGTTPTNWGVTGTANNVTRTVVGSGTEDGIPYVDIQYAGTPSASSSVAIRCDQVNGVPAAMGQLWSCALFCRVVAGSLNGVGPGGNPGKLRTQIAERDGSGSLTSTSVYFAPTTAALRTQRQQQSRVLQMAATQFIVWQTTIDYTVGVPIDLTLRIGAPQMEQGVAESSHILGTVATTRATDILTLGGLANGTYDFEMVHEGFSEWAYNVAVGAGSYVVPTSVSPLQQVKVYGPRFSFGFMGGTLPAGAALTRASVGWVFDNAGVLQSRAVDVARFPYDTTTLAARGLLNEATETNLLRSSDFTGGVDGSPGTLPTGWTTAGSFAGITRTISHGVADGIPYTRIRLQGTPSGTGTAAFDFDARTQIPAAAGETYTATLFVALSAGSLANAGTTSFRINGWDAGGTTSQENSSLSYTPTAAPLKSQKVTLARTMTAGGTARVTSRFQWAVTAGQPIDFTLDYGVPVLVRSNTISSVPTISSGTPFTRAADVLALAVPNGTYNVQITRESGVALVPGVVVGAGSYTVPTDPSPVRSVTLQ